MNLVVVQRYIKLKFLARKNINQDINKINETILNISFLIKEYFEKNIVSIDEYNYFMMEIKSISCEKNKIELLPFFSEKIKTKRKKINSILKKLKKLVCKTGISDFGLVMYLLFSNKNNIDNLNYLNKVFVSSSIRIYHKNITFSSKSEKSIHSYDIKNIQNKESGFYNLYNEKKLVDIIYGITFFFKHTNYIIVCEGYLKSDNLDILKNTFFKTDLDSITKSITKLKIKKTFKSLFINQLSLKDIIISDNVVSECFRLHKLLREIKCNNISYLVKKFLSETVINQRNIILTLLLDDEDVNMQYMSYLLYDLIKSDSYLIKNTGIATSIYNSFSWTIQNKLKINNTNYNNKIKNIASFYENTFSYEKKIMLLKTDESVKSKAMIKYKEIISKGNENGKAQQYLDALLNIPFGIYIKETIFYELDEIKEDLQLYTEQYVSYLQKNKDNNIDSDNPIKTRSDIDIFFIKMEEITNEISFKKINVVFTSLRTLKISLKNLKYIAQNMNTIYNCSIKINNKKSDIIEHVIDYFCKETDIKNKKQICDLFNIDYKTQLDGCDDTKKLNVLSNKWTNYKLDVIEYLDKSRQILDSVIYKQDNAKNEIVRIIGQWINGNMNGYCFGFEGPPGVGKTTFAKEGLSRCLLDNGKSRPFSFIQIGGSSNGSTIEGHNYTYLGSKYGKIAEILIDKKCLNPIIYIDELDKVSKTEQGKEIISILTHITDMSQNSEFEDKYFSGIKLDLSKILFIFSYNDSSLIDPILLDRIHTIEFKSYNNDDKINICNKFIIPNICSEIGIGKENIIFSREIISYIIDSYTDESGVRKIKQKITELLREINLKFIKNELKYPFSISTQFIDSIFSDKPKITRNKILSSPFIGIVYGMYATNTQRGGITTIQCEKIYNEHFFIQITGNQGDIMKESVHCAKTVAWNRLDNDLKTKIRQDQESNKWGLHLHCPDTSTPKDGPSAGAAIAISMLSVFKQQYVRNNIAITGEIDIKGNVKKIGGLRSKIDGGKKEGIDTFIYPSENQDEIDRITQKNPVFTKNIKLIPVSSIDEIINIIFV
jgi:hypothetical protein